MPEQINLRSVVVPDVKSICYFRSPYASAWRGDDTGGERAEYVAAYIFHVSKLYDDTNACIR
jgi:hypothetical protein